MWEMLIQLSLHPHPTPNPNPTWPPWSFGLVLGESASPALCFHRLSSFASSNPSPQLIFPPQITGHPLQEGFLDPPVLWLQLGGVLRGDPPSPWSAPPPPLLRWLGGVPAGGGRSVRSGIAGAALDPCPFPKATVPFQLAPANRGVVR